MSKEKKIRNRIQFLGLNYLFNCKYKPNKIKMIEVFKEEEKVAIKHSTTLNVQRVMINDAAFQRCYVFHRIFQSDSTWLPS